MPEEINACTANFISPMMQQSLPAEFSNHLRSLGFESHGRVQAGFMPGGFTLPPASPGLEGTFEPDMAWGPGATIRVKFLDGDGAFKDRVEQYVKSWSDVANVKFRFVTGAETSDVRV